MSTRWTPEARMELVERLQARPGAESETFFDAHNLGASYRRPGSKTSKRARINSALHEAEGRGEIDQVLDAALSYLGGPPLADEESLITEQNGQFAIALPDESVERDRIPKLLTGPAPHTSDSPPQVRRVWFENFKGYRQFEADLGRFNVLVGANNAGKSTLLQGVDLIFSLLKLHSEGDRLAASGRLVPPSILPVAALRDLFHNGAWRTGNEYVFAIVGAEFSDGSSVEFGLRLMFGNGNSRVRGQSGMDGKRLLALLSHPAVWVPSAVGIVRDEEYRTAARRAGLISAGRHNEVLRNLLVALQTERPERFDLLQRILSERFHGRLTGVTFDEALDQFVSAEYFDNSGARHDLYSAGAGFIQVVQLLAFILTRDGSVVLLDEPDAHLHSSLQRVVVEILDEIAENQSFQIVLATHSKEIINFVDPTRLVFIESGTTQASPVSAAVTPVTILRSLGAIDNIDAFALVRNRRCLFVEGPTDATILGRFAATLGIHAFTGDGRVVPVPTSGADKFEHVQQLDVLEGVLGGPLQSLELRDRDARLAASRERVVAESQRPLHIFERDCVESYLIDSTVIARVINEIAEERGKTVNVTAADVENILATETDDMRDTTIDRVANRHISDELGRGNRVSVASANPLARDAIGAAWSTLDDRLNLVSGKQLIGRLRRRIQDNYGVNFGNERLAEAFRAEEIPIEVRDALRRVEELQVAAPPRKGK
jgi:ABC-type cobalamin/Fe3+-siderophores transport system ATPase subunit